MYRQLNITNYKTHIILGNNPEERNDKRPIIINISLRFLRGNAACNSDDLTNTVCYSSFLNFLEKKLENNNFKLIEKAAQFIYDSVTEYLKDNSNKQDIQKRVECIKPNPPVNNLEAVSFVVSDW